MSRSHRPHWPYFLNRASPQAVGLQRWWTWPFGAASAVELARGGGIAAPPTSPAGSRADPVTGVGAHFDGTAYYTHPDADAPYLGELTYAFWCILDTPSFFHTFLHKGDVATDNVGELRTENSVTTLAVIRATPTGFHYWNGPAPSTGVLHHIVVAMGALVEDTPRFCIDGVCEDGTLFSSSDSGSPTSNGGDWQIGRRSDGLPFAGAMFDVRVYDRKLTDGEMQAMYAPATRWELYGQTKRRSYKAAAAAGGFVPYPRPRGLVGGMSVMAGGLA